MRPDRHMPPGRAPVSIGLPAPRRSARIAMKIPAAATVWRATGTAARSVLNSRHCDDSPSPIVDASCRIRTARRPTQYAPIRHASVPPPRRRPGRLLRGCQSGLQVQIGRGQGDVLPDTVLWRELAADGRAPCHAEGRPAAAAVGGEVQRRTCAGCAASRLAAGTDRGHPTEACAVALAPATRVAGTSPRSRPGCDALVSLKLRRVSSAHRLSPVAVQTGEPGHDPKLQFSTSAPAASLRTLPAACSCVRSGATPSCRIRQTACTS